MGKRKAAEFVLRRGVYEADRAAGGQGEEKKRTQDFLFRRGPWWSSLLLFDGWAPVIGEGT